MSILTNQQLTDAIEDLREHLNEVYNDHAEMKQQIKRLLKNRSSGRKTDTQAHNTCRPLSTRKPA